MFTTRGLGGPLTVNHWIFFSISIGDRQMSQVPSAGILLPIPLPS